MQTFRSTGGMYHIVERTTTELFLHLLLRAEVQFDEVDALVLEILP